jgi:hypothetical protein
MSNRGRRGPPTYKEAAGSKTKGKSQTSPREKTRKSSEPGTHRENSGKVERWFYNCGEYDFVYILTFEGGVLTKEETKGYGKGRSDCRGDGKRPFSFLTRSCGLC